MLTVLLCIGTLFGGVFLGVFVMGWLAAGAREDECRECVWRRQQLVEHWNDHADGHYTAAGVLTRRRSLIRAATWRAAHRRN